MLMKLIELKNVMKSFKKDNRELKILDNANVCFENGKIYAIVGESGAGKSTLLNCISLVEKLDDGKIFYKDKDITNIKEKEICNYRKNVGFIFQNYYLDEYLTALENVMVPLLLTDMIIEECRDKAMKQLENVGLKDRMNHYPRELSGGEQQRVAIARALVRNPQIILADEPTGNLDEKNEKNILELIKQIDKKDKCIIIVTHSSKIKKIADVVFEIKQGKLMILSE